MTTEREQADKFVKAVADGATVYAGPETARLLKNFLPVNECQWMEEGVLYAVDMRKFNLGFNTATL